MLERMKLSTTVSAEDKRILKIFLVWGRDNDVSSRGQNASALKKQVIKNWLKQMFDSFEEKYCLNGIVFKRQWLSGFDLFEAQEVVITFESSSNYLFGII